MLALAIDDSSSRHWTFELESVLVSWSWFQCITVCHSRRSRRELHTQYYFTSSLSSISSSVTHLRFHSRLLDKLLSTTDCAHFVVVVFHLHCRRSETAERRTSSHLFCLLLTRILPVQSFVSSPHLLCGLLLHSGVIGWGGVGGGGAPPRWHNPGDMGWHPNEIPFCGWI